ncbi:MAG: alanine acetyltransferase [Rhodospirillaceae bacterium]|nr:alanine acetyltransferase [Rhodospirillaceae bacterium]
MKCYCSIGCKTAGSMGPVINLSGDSATLTIEGEENIRVWHAVIDGETSPTERRFCKHCGTALWGYDARWPELIHPFAGIIDSELPPTPETVHIMLDSAPSWVDVPPTDVRIIHFAGYPDLSIEDWYKQQDLWST